MVKDKKSKKCATCKRSDIFFDGCSILDCPNRKRITANYQDSTAPFCQNGGGYIKEPTSKDN